MAVYPIIISPPQTLPAAQQGASVRAWTEQVTETLHSVDLSAGPVRSTPVGRSVAISGTLDAEREAEAHESNGREHAHDHGTRLGHPAARRSEPMRRDSLKRREALLKGKEGSRQRRRWENDRLLNNPWAQAPLPSDWEIHPTYPRHAVPYYLAPLWDAEALERSIERKKRGRIQGRRASIGPAEEAASSVPKDVRSKLKHARAAKSLLQGLEEEVRVFLQKWNEKEAKLRDDGLHDVDSSEEEEIVFVGRNGHMHDGTTREKAFKDLQRNKLVFDGLADDRGASFGRWLVHSIANYYGLCTWSVTVGDPARREAYVGLGERKASWASGATKELPRPLWVMV